MLAGLLEESRFNVLANWKVGNVTGLQKAVGDNRAQETGCHAIRIRCEHNPIGDLQVIAKKRTIDIGGGYVRQRRLARLHVGLQVEEPDSLVAVAVLANLSKESIWRLADVEEEFAAAVSGGVVERHEFLETAVPSVLRLHLEHVEGFRKFAFGPGLHVLQVIFAAVV